MSIVKTAFLILAIFSIANPALADVFPNPKFEQEAKEQLEKADRNLNNNTQALKAGSALLVTNTMMNLGKVRTQEQLDLIAYLKNKHVMNAEKIAETKAELISSKPNRALTNAEMLEAQKKHRKIAYLTKKNREIAARLKTPSYKEAFVKGLSRTAYGSLGLAGLTYAVVTLNQIENESSADCPSNRICARDVAAKINTKSASEERKQISDEIQSLSKKIGSIK